MNYGKIYVYNKSLLIWKQIPFILILLVVIIIALNYIDYKKKNSHDELPID